MNIWRMVSFGWMPISGSQDLPAVSPSDVWRFEAEGQTVRLRRNGAVVFQLEDIYEGGIAGGSPGFYVYSAASGPQTRLTTWGASRIGEMLPPLPPGPPPESYELARDLFERPDESPLAVPWRANNPEWWPLRLSAGGVMAAITNKACSAIYGGVAWPKDQYSEAHATAPIGAVGLLLRADATVGTGLVMLLTTNWAGPYRMFSSGGWQNIAPIFPFSPPLSSTDLWRFEGMGRRLRLYRNGVVIWEHIDDGPDLVGSPGVHVEYLSARIEDWAGGGIGQAPPPEEPPVERWPSGELVTEAFVRPDELPIRAPWVTVADGAWGQVQLRQQAATNVTDNTTSIALHDGRPWPQDQYAEVIGTLARAGAIGPVVRGDTGAHTGYVLLVTAESRLGLYRMLPQGWMNMGQPFAVPTPLPTDRWSLEIKSQTLRVWRNGDLLQEHTDTFTGVPFPVGIPGLYVSSVGERTTVTRWSAGWVGQEPPPEEPPPPPPPPEEPPVEPPPAPRRWHVTGSFDIVVEEMP
jgi:hypothetical protein